MNKEWEVKATIEIRKSFFCETKKEAEEEARKYLSKLCHGLYLECCSTDYNIDNAYTYEVEETTE